jgi:hypothetical protein
MTIGMIVAIVFGVFVLIFGIGALIYGFVKDEVGMGVGIFITGLVIGLVLIITPIVYSNTAAGQRAYKDQQSNFNVNQITREVIVYDINGDVITTYTGKFDIETDNEKYILFDDEDGLRHIIYYTTGTVIVNEVR